MSLNFRWEQKSARVAQVISGSPREIGRALGQIAKPIWAAFTMQSEIWQELQQWYGTQHFRDLAALTQVHFANFWEELVGMAEGINCPVQDIFLWNCRGDLLHKTNDGCTSVAVKYEDSIWLAHNEDGDPFFSPFWKMLEVRPDNSPDFVTFYYPGSIPGHTFGVNCAGIVQTINNLRTRPHVTGVPRMVLARAILAAETLNEAEDILRRTPRAGGFHHLLAQTGNNRILSIEATPEICSVQVISEKCGHANHAIHADRDVVDQVVTVSSRDRQSRLCVLLKRDIRNSADLLAVLDDIDGPGLPIFRTDANDPDNENTMATGFFHVSSNAIYHTSIDRTSGNTTAVELSV